MCIYIYNICVITICIPHLIIDYVLPHTEILRATSTIPGGRTIPGVRWRALGNLRPGCDAERE